VGLPVYRDGRDMFEALVRLCRQLELDGLMIVVRRRRDVLDENRNRLAFMTNNLEHDPTLDEGHGRIREHYADGRG